MTQQTLPPVFGAHPGLLEAWQAQPHGTLDESREFPCPHCDEVFISTTRKG